MSVRTWLGLGGADAHGLLEALRALDCAGQASIWTDLVLQVDEAASIRLMAGLPHALDEVPPSAWPVELPGGFHPLRLGRLHVLVCIGPLNTCLGELVCQAHAVWMSGVELQQVLDAGGHGQTANTFTRLARCCARHGVLTISSAPDTVNPASNLHRAGFSPADTGANPTWLYQPPWPLKTSTWSLPGEQHAVVVGAGLAGAAATCALVRRGWRVHLVDAQPASAMGASGLPVGVMTEHQASHDTVLSALSRVGVPLHVRELTHRIPVGKGWQPAVVANLKDVSPDQIPLLADVLTDPTIASRRQAGALVRPAALVNAWLEEARHSGRLTETWDHPISHIGRAPGTVSHWLIHPARHTSPIQAPVVVLASAFGTQALLSTHLASQALPLRPVKGQLTLGARVGEPLAPCPIRHQGVWVPDYTDSGLPQSHTWAMGSTYERGINHTDCSPQGRDANLKSLHSLSPDAHDQVTASPLSDWAGVRCASQDRLPLAGALPAFEHIWSPSDRLEHIPREPGLWTLCALGSRGLTLAALLGEWLAAQMSGAPWPLQRSHALALDPARFALRHARKPG